MLSVFFLRDVTLTRCQTLFNMIIQARTIFSDILGQIAVAGTDLPQFMDQFNGIMTAPALV